MSKDKYINNKSHQYYLQDNIHEQNHLKTNNNSLIEETFKALPRIYGRRKSLKKNATASSKQNSVKNFKRSCCEKQKCENQHIEQLINKYLPERRKIMPIENDNMKVYTKANPLQISKLEQDNSYYSSLKKISLLSEKRKDSSHQKYFPKMKEVTPPRPRKIILEKLPQKIEVSRLQNQSIHKILKRNINPLTLPPMSDDEQQTVYKKQYRFKTQTKNINIQEGQQQQSEQENQQFNRTVQTEKQIQRFMASVKNSQTSKKEQGSFRKQQTPVKRSQISVRKSQNSVKKQQSSQQSNLIKKISSQQITPNNEINNEISEIRKNKNDSNKSSQIVEEIQEEQQNLLIEKIEQQQMAQNDENNQNLSKSSKSKNQYKNISTDTTHLIIAQPYPNIITNINSIPNQCEEPIQLPKIEYKQIGIDTNQLTYQDQQVNTQQFVENSKKLVEASEIKEQKTIQKQQKQIDQVKQIINVGTQAYIQTQNEQQNIQKVLVVQQATQMELLNKTDQSTQIKQIKNLTSTYVQTLDMLQQLEIKSISQNINNQKKKDEIENESVIQSLGDQKKKEKIQSEEQLIFEIDKNDNQKNQISIQVQRIKLQDIIKKSQSDTKTIFLNLLKKQPYEKEKLRNSRSITLRSVSTNFYIKIPTKEELPIWIDNYKPLDVNFYLKQLIKSSFFKIVPFKNGLYLGQFKQKQREGFGIFITQKCLFEGEFKNNLKFKGSESNNQGIYKGTIVNGLRQGSGQFRWYNEQTYVGQWKNGLKHGKGIWKSPNGDYYDGEWIQNKQQGYGIHQHNKSLYKGQFKNYLKHGKGEQRFSNEDTFIGEYFEGKPNGNGEYVWKNGCKYKGTFFNGMKHGYGILEDQGNTYKVVQVSLKMILKTDQVKKHIKMAPVSKESSKAIYPQNKVSTKIKKIKYTSLIIEILIHSFNLQIISIKDYLMSLVIYGLQLPFQILKLLNIVCFVAWLVLYQFIFIQYRKNSQIFQNKFRFELDSFILSQNFLIMIASQCWDQC